MKFVFTLKEVKEILISAVVLSVAFALAFTDGIANVLNNTESFPLLVVFSFIAVGVGFLAHELIGHKLFAQKYGLHAEYKVWPMGLGLALVTSLFGVIFAAPGAVYIQEKLDMWGKRVGASTKKMGITSVMGPVVNVAIALVFLTLNSVSPSQLFALGTSINIWLAFFNMLPIPPLDGSKVLAWDRRIFAAVFVATLLLTFVFVF